MNIRDNSLASVFGYLRSGLLSVFSERESLNIARLLFEKKFGLRPVDMVMQADRRFSESEMLTVHFALKEMKKFRPPQYVLGVADFMGMELMVNEAVLIPRPETEEMVRMASLYVSEGEAHVLDVGTGSGCIALGIKKLRPEARVKGIDISLAALEVANTNGNHQGGSVVFEQGDILALTPMTEVWDLIISNPPYIRPSEAQTMGDNVAAYEPHLALFVPEEDPLVYHRSLASWSATALKLDGRLFTEINPVLADETCALFITAGLHDVRLHRDLQDNLRICSGVRRP